LIWFEKGLVEGIKSGGISETKVMLFSSEEGFETFG